MTDAELLHRYTDSHDENAFRRLADRHIGFVYHTALRVTGNQETAREICQNVFLLLARKAARLPARGGLGPWLHATATLQARNAKRGETRRQRALDAFRHTMPVTAKPSSGDDHDRHPALPYLDEAVEKLAASEREVLIEHYHAGRTYGEIARLRRETEAAVQRRASRALEKLALALRRRGIVTSGSALAGLLAATLPVPAPASVSFTLESVPVTTPSALWTAPGRAAALVLAGAVAAGAGYAGARVTQPSPHAPSVERGSASGSEGGTLATLQSREVPPGESEPGLHARLTEAARDLRREGDRLAQARAAFRLSPWKTADFREALGWASALPHDDEARTRLMGLVMLLMAKEDPAASWAALAEIPEDSLTENTPDWADGVMVEARRGMEVLFLKLWDRDPAACVAGLGDVTGWQKEAVWPGARRILESEPDRRRWMALLEQASTDQARQEGARITVGWAGAHPDQAGGVLTWMMNLPFRDPSLAARTLGVLTWNGEEQEPAVSAWMAGLPAEEKERARGLVLDSFTNAPEEARIRFAGATSDAPLKNALLKNL